jgi:hypothetical protein
MSLHSSGLNYYCLYSMKLTVTSVSILKWYFFMHTNMKVDIVRDLIKFNYFNISSWWTKCFVDSHSRYQKLDKVISTVMENMIQDLKNIKIWALFWPDDFHSKIGIINKSLFLILPISSIKKIIVVDNIEELESDHLSKIHFGIPISTSRASGAGA